MVCDVAKKNSALSEAWAGGPSVVRSNADDGTWLWQSSVMETVRAFSDRRRTRICAVANRKHQRVTLNV